MKGSEERRIIFHHKRAVGDGLMFTAGVRDFKLLFPKFHINVVSNYPQLWENNPYLDRSLKKGKEVEYYYLGYPTIQTCNNGVLHFSTGFFLDMLAQTDAHETLPISLGEFAAAFANGEAGDPDLGNPEKNPKAKEPFISWQKKYKAYFKVGEKKKGLSERFARQRPDLHVSEEEQTINPIARDYGIDKYWVVAPGGKEDCTCKVWDWRRMQTVIDHYEGLIKFVTIGKGNHIVDKLKNVIDLTDKTSIRDLIHLTYHAQGCVTGVSLLAHIAAALPQPDSRSRKPCVQIFGGREPTTYTWYCNHQILHTNGALQCCEQGGCWQSRVIPLSQGKPGENKRLCHQPIVSDGRTIPKCMDMITAQDVIRAIERYFEGGLYTYMKPKELPKEKVQPEISLESIGESKRAIKQILSGKTPVKGKKKAEGPKIENEDSATKYPIKPPKEINFLASLQSKGGGEQSAVKIVEMLRADGWKVNLYPWEKIHSKFKDIDISPNSFKSGKMPECMKKPLPLFFYANDQIWDFCKQAQEIVEKSSSVIVGINWANGPLPKATWMKGKLRAVVFQNREKMGEWDRDVRGLEDVERVLLYGAIDLEKYLEVKMKRRGEKEPLVVLRHSMPDYRKFITTESENNGEKIHTWQKHFYKEKDTRFYERLTKDCKFPIRFRFMQAHAELADHYKGDERFNFLKFDEIPVTEFLASGHVYLHRCSNLWRDNYPRVVAEALAAGLPILSEPRDGTLDRIQPGDTGFHLVDYDGFLYALKMLHRKEDYRYALGLNAKKWAKQNLNPKRWVDEINRILL